MKNLFLLLLCIPLLTFSQINSDSSILIPLININYSPQLPGGDLAERFGFNSAIGAGFDIKTKNNWDFGINYSFMFGNKVKDTAMLENLKTSSGFIINQNGDFANYRIFERGHHINFTAGKVFPVLSKNKNSGLLLKIGIGLLIHKVKIFNLAEDVPQLLGEYSKGYDRYTSGLSTSQFLGYRYLSDNKLINFYAGFEFIQGYTKLRRDYQVDLDPDLPVKNRLDLLYGIKVGWILPLRSKESKDFYY